MSKFFLSRQIHTKSKMAGMYEVYEVLLKAINFYFSGFVGLYIYSVSELRRIQGTFKMHSTIIDFTNFINVSNTSDHRVCDGRWRRMMKRPIKWGRKRNNTTITKTRLYSFDPLTHHFYIVKHGFTGVYTIFLISAHKHKLWVLAARRF